MIVKRWDIKDRNQAQRDFFSKALGISGVTAQVLVNRGIASVEEADRFLNPSLKNLPDPFLLPDMDRGVDRILAALQKKEKIAVYGDYDVDGLSSAALLIRFFGEIGVDIAKHIPDRIQEGYGLNNSAIEKLKKAGVSLIITVDCGTKSIGPIDHAKSLGMDIIVTDHHVCEGELPEAYALINPQRGEVGKELAGAGVAFFLLIALRQKLRGTDFFREQEPNLKQYLDLVALGTVGDLVPLQGINRTLVTFGLTVLTDSQLPGLVALKNTAGIKEGAVMQTSDIGFRLAPRLNAGGRIAQASLGLELLTATDKERADKLAIILNQCNQDRQEMQEKQVRKALSMAGKKESGNGFVIASEDFHPGIVGLIASKLAEKFYRPAFALSIEGKKIKGSGRSIPALHIVEILDQCSDLLESYGGHAAACGLTLALEKLESFEYRFMEIMKKTDLSFLTPHLVIDAEVSLSKITDDFLNELERLKPFGMGNREPLFATKGVRFKNETIVGKTHLKMDISDGNGIQFGTIGFNLGDRHPLPKKEGEIAFSPGWNEYLGRRSIQLKIKDIR